MEQVYEQQTYSAVIRYGGNPHHSMPLTDVTRTELKLLAFIHGARCFPVEFIKPTGKKVITEMRVVEGRKQSKIIASEMEEMKRLARKYDTLGDHDGVNRGRKYVEKCFGTKLDDFDDMMEAIDPVTLMERALAEADIKDADAARPKDPGEVRAEEVAPPQPPAVPPPQTLGLGGIFKRANEGVSP